MKGRTRAIAALLALSAALADRGSRVRERRPSCRAGQRRRAADVALIACGNTRTMGLLAPFTGPAASLGAQQIDWVKYYIARLQQRTQEEAATRRRRHAARRAGRHGGGTEGGAVVSSSNVLGASDRPGSNEVRGPRRRR